MRYHETHYGDDSHSVFDSSWVLDRGHCIQSAGDSFAHRLLDGALLSRPALFLGFTIHHPQHAYHESPIWSIVGSCLWRQPEAPVVRPALGALAAHLISPTWIVAFGLVLSFLFIGVLVPLVLSRPDVAAARSAALLALLGRLLSLTETALRGTHFRWCRNGLHTYKVSQVPLLQVQIRG